MPCPEKFKESLELFGVPSSIIDEINNGYEKLVSSSKIQEKSLYFFRAMVILDKNIDNDLKSKIMDFNACCKSGVRDKNVKLHAKKISALTLPDKIRTIKKIPNMGNPVLRDDGCIVTGIYYRVDEKFTCVCPNFHRLKKQPAVSLTYCWCCAGHFRYHYQNALGITLKTKQVKSSPLNSSGRDPCVFVFEQAE
ncbi:hypothetical protein [Breznakiella homolactica]|uniref:L-2-amino-thiazoline-4-carboxylic acid hydrolase n=1 Tax=Breznakiella homolactica TaxID=2798577 RepID=A0A7T7XLT1_9SPIR|nr:hypothetical protein [Breznakiella homolactica]QQO08716.1 hypothetical protein JFL75_17585 [Breznakiella homolactica]